MLRLPLQVCYCEIPVFLCFLFLVRFECEGVRERERLFLGSFRGGSLEWAAILVRAEQVKIVRRLACASCNSKLDGLY